MLDSSYDPYYRNFPSTALPARTPFTRSGRKDAGYVFFYLTHKKPNWSLLLEKSRMEYIYAEAGLRIPKDFTQFLLLEKLYSTGKANAAASSHRKTAVSQPPATSYAAATTLLVLREPDPVLTGQGDIVSYHLQPDEAIAAAETYTRLHNRRAIVGALLWDERWY